MPTLLPLDPVNRSRNITLQRRMQSTPPHRTVLIAVDRIEIKCAPKDPPNTLISSACPVPSPLEYGLGLPRIGPSMLLNIANDLQRIKWE